MTRIYPENIPKKNDDIVYDLMKTVVFTLCFCVCTCVGIIVVLTSMIENEIQDGSN